MAIDKLQNAIRKLKNPSAVMFSLDKRHIPCKILEENTGIAKAYSRYAKELLDALKGVVPAVRFGFGHGVYLRIFHRWLGYCGAIAEAALSQCTHRPGIDGI